MKLNDLEYIIRRVSLLPKVSKLKIVDADVEDGLAKIKLESGLLIWGTLTLDKSRKYYKLLSNKVKNKLPLDCFNLACDIVIRYMEGGLKYGGPAKELHYSVKKGDVVAEMGAFMGHYTLYLSEKVGANGKVIAIEPMPDNLNILRKNVREVENVTVVPKAVWKEKDSLTFARRKGDNQSGSIELAYDNTDEFIIEGDSLDHILNEHGVEQVDFMLIQLNGVEYEALLGLEKHKPSNLAIAARYSPDDAPIVPKIVKLLKDRGYNCVVEQSDYIYASI